MWSRRGKVDPGSGVLVMAFLAIHKVCPVIAQPQHMPGAPAFRAESTLVLIPVAVIDRRGAVVNGLRSGAFTVTEDGVRQEIRSFSQEDVPVSMGIVLDLSGSMRPVLGPAKESLRALIHEANPADEAFLRSEERRG